MIYRIRLLGILSGLAIGLTHTGHAGAAEYEARIWADKSGKFEIRATFIDVIDGKVRLERPRLQPQMLLDRDYRPTTDLPPTCRQSVMYTLKR